ncbi:MAG: HAD-IB family phosphatase [Acidimicrobiia bacterium]|nr:HAD-IB family phosphatase [Acidimicrobiia bacterium]
MSSRVLVTDFDGTMTRRDFFSCAVDRLLTPNDLDPWNLYTAGEITHFEALRRIFARIRADEEDLVGVMEAMEIDPDLASAIERLEDAGWRVVIVSNGCRWYIDRLLSRTGVEAVVYSNPGSFDPASGLSMELPEDSPYFDPEVGISKGAVVQAHLDRGETVAFAGDGRPDVDPALRVRPELRFAREWLAEHLERTGESYQEYEAWSDVAQMLVTR